MQKQWAKTCLFFHILSVY